MKIAIVGSRNYKDLQKVKDFVKRLYDRAVIAKVDLTIVSGGAIGVDSAAESEARALGLKTIVIKPKYRFPNDREAPLLRNTEIVEVSDYVYAFRSPGKSNGTDDTIRKANNVSKLIKVFD